MVCRTDGREAALADLAVKFMCGNTDTFQVTESHSSPVSPPPFMVGMVELELDKATGQVELIDYKAVVDCGTPINPALARVQTEGGIVPGIGMALFENVQYTGKGKMKNNSFMQISCPPVWTWEGFRWSLRAAMRRQDRSVQNPSVRS